LRKNNYEINVGEWETEIEAAQAYNIATIIINGTESHLNEVPPPSMETYTRVLRILRGQGWMANQNDMRKIKNLLRVYLGMDFKSDA
jgi:hypothetical protein